MQCSCYRDRTSKYNAHVDNAGGAKNDGRILSMILYLNDDFEGGETKFYAGAKLEDLVASVAPVAGSALLFPQAVGDEALPEFLDALFQGAFDSGVVLNLSKLTPGVLAAGIEDLAGDGAAGEWAMSWAGGSTWTGTRR